jgi:hypothetical protein
MICYINIDHSLHICIVWFHSSHHILVETKCEQFCLWLRPASSANLKEKRVVIIWSMQLFDMDKLNKQNTRQKETVELTAWWLIAWIRVWSFLLPYFQTMVRILLLCVWEYSCEYFTSVTLVWGEGKQCIRLFLCLFLHALYLIPM